MVLSTAFPSMPPRVTSKGLAAFLSRREWDDARAKRSSAEMPNSGSEMPPHRGSNMNRAACLLHPRRECELVHRTLTSLSEPLAPGKRAP